jgi:hypothetical protein
MTFFLPRSLAAWNTPAFADTFKREIERIAPACLPLQQGLSGTSAVADAPFSVMLLQASGTAAGLRVKAGVFYAGLLGGCSCADDPTPLAAEPEYCALWIEIARPDGAAQAVLAEDATN